MSEEGGNEGGNWFDSFPSEVQQWDEVKNSDGLDQFWQRITSHRKHLGQSIRIPGDDASLDDMNAFYDKLQNKVPGLMPAPDPTDETAMKAVFEKLGVPKEATEYADIEGEEYSFSEGQLDKIRALALNAGLTKSQFASLARQIGVERKAELEGLSEAQAAAQESLKKEWGLAAEDRLKETDAFLRQSGAPENLIEAMSSSDLDSNTIMWLHGLSQGISETREGANQAGGAQTGELDPYEAQERINEILNNRDHPYHRGDPRSRSRMQKLMKQANPERYA